MNHPRSSRSLALAAAVVVLTAGLVSSAGATSNRSSRVAQGDDAGAGVVEHTCDGCEPPLEYQGGRVMDTTGPDGVTITPIFWAPDGFDFPEGYQDLIVRYIADIAADSGTTTNVYSLAAEYSVLEGEYQRDLEYRLTAGQTIVDTNPFPDDGCDVADGYDACLTDDQLRDELEVLIDANGLTTDLANFYPVFFPPDVETEDLDGSNSVDGYCGYHRAYGSGDDVVAYGNEPYDEEGCGQGQAPNGDLAADGAIGVLSHEIMEALTDPEDVTTWNDATGHEIGDICAEFFGPPLGVTDADNPDTTAYNQEINGNRYYTQTEFSNAAFDAFGDGAGCQQSADAAAKAADSPIGVMLATANPNVLDADGSSTADIEVSITDPDGDSLVGDNLAFSTKVIDGSGICGELSETTGTTDADGFATVSYTASDDDVACGLVIADAMGGQSSTAVLYQGTYQSLAPAAEAAFPETITPGDDPTTFDVTFTNPGGEDFTSASVSFAIFAADGATDDVDASQVDISTSSDGADGTFEPLDLSGSTGSGGAIQGVIDDVELDAGDSLTITFEIALDDSVPSAEAPTLAMEAYLDVVNPANGAGTNLADTLASDVTISAPASGGSSAGTGLLIAGAVLVAIVAAGIVVAARRRNHEPA